MPTQDEEIARHLRALLESLGYSEVKTLLNSGNAVFDAPDGPGARHAQGIRDAVAKQLGVDALVVVKSGKEIAAIVADNPLAAAWTPEGVLASKAGAALLKGLAERGTTCNWATIEKLHLMLQGEPP